MGGSADVTSGLISGVAAVNVSDGQASFFWRFNLPCLGMTLCGVYDTGKGSAMMIRADDLFVITSSCGHADWRLLLRMFRQ